MTSPALEDVQINGQRTFAFIIPPEYTINSLPIPNDNRVIFEEISAKKIAVRTFSGAWHQAAFDKELEVLKASLEKDNFNYSDNYTRASYDPPLVPGFLRTNEVHIQLLD